MHVMELHCPACHCASGNKLTVDWPEPLNARKYAPLICSECASEFQFDIDANGMRCTGMVRHNELNDFLARRRQLTPAHLRRIDDANLT